MERFKMNIKYCGFFTNLSTIIGIKNFFSRNVKFIFKHNYVYNRIM